MFLDPLLGEDDHNPLAEYLNPSSVGAYTEKDLNTTFQNIQGKLRSIGLPLCGDIFRADIEHIKTTIKW